MFTRLLPPRVHEQNFGPDESELIVREIRSSNAEEFQI